MSSEIEVRDVLKEGLSDVTAPERLSDGWRRRAARVRAAKVASFAVFSLVAVVAGSFLIAQEDRGAAEDLPVAAVAGEPARDGDVVFELVMGECALDDRASSGSPRFCMLEVLVTNEADSKTFVEADWQILHFGKTPIRSANPHFREFFEEFHSTRHAFAEPIESGATGNGLLFFANVPFDRYPTALELHSKEGSDGVIVQLDECDFVDAQCSR